MTTAVFFRRLVASFGAVLLLGPGFANTQEISASHLEVAKDAIKAIQATDQFDIFLPSTARELKNELMRYDPDQAKVISQTVDEQAMSLVSRRADLEKEIARVYAKDFTKDELEQIKKFYSSPTGQKLLKQGPQSMAASVGAYDIWRQGIAQDLAANVRKVLNEKFNNTGKSGMIPASKLQKPADK